MSNECKLPAVLDRLSSGPGEGATGWSTRTLLGLRWGHPGGNDRGAAAGAAARARANAASAGRACAPTLPNTTTSSNASAASSNAASTMAIGGSSVVSASCATAVAAATGAAVHAITRGCFSVRADPDARNTSSAYRASEPRRDLAVRLATCAGTAFVCIARGEFRAGTIPILHSAGFATCHARISSSVYATGSATCDADISSRVYATGSATRHAAAPGRTGACCLVDGWRRCRFACARRAASDQPIPRA